MSNNNIINQIACILYASDSTCVLTGAGISTASGLKDFRGANGLYKENHSNFKPEYMLSIEGFLKHPVEVYDFYRKNLFAEVNPNKAHDILAKWESQGIVQSIITQNIDNLHQEAGSKNVVDLHGNMKTFYCPHCGANYTLDYIKSLDVLPQCTVCDKHSVLRPDIVMYGEYLDKEISNQASNAAAQADTMIVIGSSLTVPTASSLIDFYPPKNLIIINISPTDYDCQASIVVHDDIVKILTMVDKALTQLIRSEN